MNDAVVVERVTSRAELEEAWEVRFEVFVREQGVPLEEEVDDADTAPTTTHVLARSGDAVVGTGRLLSDPDHAGEVHLGRLAVHAAARGSGVGARLVTALEAIALADHGVAAGAPDGGADGGARDLTVRVVLAAQESVMGFYARLGYTVVTGERFLDAGIWHQDMARLVRA
ncbi:GNAT family N-acetyltransferase [Georgenia sp. MJ206]|uniref:GNAT family N-acetyltransferase n=1 Tax=Georgenia wangjunii TaxID=3117730 RepID=UPI002F269212